MKKSFPRAVGSPYLMKTTTIGLVPILLLLLAGCGPKSASPSSPPSTAAPVTQAALTTWQQGDALAAVTKFVETDWSSRPLFASGSALSLSEDQFKALSNKDRQAKSSEMLPQVDSLKQLAAAVAQAGREAAAKGDVAQARKYFTSLKACGAALDTSDSLALVKLVGQGLKKRADSEMAKLAP
jgi:hypothetical protein